MTAKKVRPSTATPRPAEKGGRYFAWMGGPELTVQDSDRGWQAGSLFEALSIGMACANALGGADFDYLLAVEA